ncbi:glycoside hydrolase family 19 protein [Streptomyces sp. SID3343]|uniref:glycoside hydrolase family 19 protein n=1 Tax=Streptomyces sp. SID3343 TaxID=2690260 RepID=UPI001368DFFF|nr:glycoside hydrolase family 19 protein [Streptomyces sp. SID3343]MYW01549.1 chitinase [Streptomyces sp. SID3343]
MAFLVAIAFVGVLAAILPMASSASAASCASGWSSSAVYTGGATASYNGHNWGAKWWTQGETPGTSDVWADQGTCSGGSTTGGGTGGTTTGGSTGGGGTNCVYPNWAAGTDYAVGAIVKYTDGKLYRAKNANPGYDPVISTWFWEPYTCTGTTTGGTTTGGTTGGGGNPGSFVVSEAQFNQMFPNRNPFYTYAGLTAALSAYPGFANTGSDTVKRQEAAAFLANVNHETGGLFYIVEQNTANYPHYCDANQPYGCPAGQAAYYGRGPIQLSWNFNYKAAGDALGINLLNNPNLVQTDPAVAWKTGLWYWNTQNGPGTMTPHNAMVNGAGFGETIRSINGSLECNGGNPAQVQSRINSYQSFVSILGTTPGNNLSC